MRKIAILAMLAGAMSILACGNVGAEDGNNGREQQPSGETSPDGFYTVGAVVESFAQPLLAAQQSQADTISFTFTFADKVLINGVQRNFQISFRPLEFMPKDAQGKPITASSYVDEHASGHYHYLRCDDDKSFNDYVNKALKTDFAKTPLYIHFDPQHVTNGTYELTFVKPKAGK